MLPHRMTAAASRTSFGDKGVGGIVEARFYCVLSAPSIYSSHFYVFCKILSNSVPIEYIRRLPRDTAKEASLGQKQELREVFCAEMLLVPISAGPGKYEPEPIESSPDPTKGR